MSPPAFIGLFNGRRRDLAPLYKPAHLLQFALHIVLATAAHLPDNCARFGQIRMKAQEINTVPQRVNVRFVVQRTVGIDVADVVGVRRIRRIKMYPERFSSPRFVPLLPRGRHVLHFKRKF